jgi:SAM-dependent methyltransferase
MNSPADIKSFYELAGIDDLADFYKQRYASNEVLNAEYFDAIHRFDIRWSRTLWVYDNVRRGSTVLDAGCGSGLLALLKRKEVKLTGVDLSPECADIARRNGYDATHVTDLASLPFPDASFDYVVSLDVFGHIEFAQKDAVIREMSRVLKPDGVTMHGIECLDRQRRKDYTEMTDEELSRYIQIDGHVGMETERDIGARFCLFFRHVQSEPRFAVCQSHSEFLKQSDDYGRPYCEPDFLAYLRQMSFKERRAFDMAMGYVFERVSEAGVSMPQSEYLFLKAANNQLGSFYNEHRDRSDLLPASGATGVIPPLLLDHSPGALFDSGWYEAECFPPIARWIGERAAVRFDAASFSTIRLQLQSHLPSIETRPLTLKFFLNGIETGALTLAQYGWLEIEIDAREVASRRRKDIHQSFEFEIRANRVWQPRLVDSQSTDDRELSVAVCNIEILP